MIEEKINIDNFHTLSAFLKGHIFLQRHDIIEKLVYSMMDEKRYQHSLEVAKLAKALAIKHHVDPDKAYLAGLLHDITKRLSIDEQKLYLSYYDPDKVCVNDKVMHAYSAKYFIKEKLNLYDYDILNAIYHHTDGLSNAKMAMIIFIADKREATRGIWDKVTEVMYDDLYLAFKLLKEDVKEYLIKRGEYTELSN